MTEKQLRQKVVDTAVSYYGCKESDGSHRKIIDFYNASPPLARGYKMTYTDAWCACFVSVVALKAGVIDIMPKEVSCIRMIDLYKGLGRWQESDAHTPDAGDIIFYDWQDSGTGDNVGAPDHVGIVVSVSGGTIKAIEGNMSNAVNYRNLAVNGKSIRGYGLPDYAGKSSGSNSATEAPPLKSIYEIAKEVISGKWGNGQERINRLTSAGYNASVVQQLVNALLKQEK